MLSRRIGIIVLIAVVTAVTTSLIDWGMEHLQLSWDTNTIFAWGAYAGAAVTLCFAPRNIYRWIIAHRVYGGIPTTLLRQIFSYTIKSKMGDNTFTILAFYLCFPVFLLLYFLVSSETPIFPMLALLVASMGWLQLYILPPTILLLGTSRPENARLVGLLNRRLWAYRTVALLEPKDSSSAPMNFFSNNLRTINGYEWRTVAYHLMDVVPVILFDTTVESIHTKTELQRLRDRRLLEKVLQISTPKNPGKGFPHNVESLVPHITQLIANQKSSTGRRKRAQVENWNMVSVVPKRIRFNSDLSSRLEKAEYILAWQLVRYLNVCRGGAPAELELVLIEDLPLTVSREEDLRYLRDGRGFDEFRSIIQGVLEEAEQTPGDDQKFHIAIARLKLGQEARYQRDWPRAMDLIPKAIQELMGCSPKSGSSIAAQKEIANGLCSLGEVYMAVFRQTRDEAHRVAAEQFFLASAAQSKQARQSFSAAQNRLMALPGRLPV